MPRLEIPVVDGTRTAAQTRPGRNSSASIAYPSRRTCFELFLDPVDVGDRVGRVLLQRRGLQQSAALSGRQLRHDDFSARRTVRGHARTRLQRKAQRLRRFHAVEVEDLVAGQRGQVAALAEFFHQVTQDGVTRAVVGVVEQQAFGHPAQPGAGPVVTAVVLPDQQSGTFELLQHAMQRRLGHPGRLDKTPAA